MRKSFILVGILLTCLNVFADGTPKVSHRCIDYEHAMSQTQGVFDWSIKFVPDWFDHLELADDISDYSKEFLQEHGGRAGTIVVKSQKGDCLEHDYDLCYSLGCSGTLIGKNYFITAGHCATTKTAQGEDVKNIGVLFGYQLADFEDYDNKINDGDNEESLYPRVSTEGYVDENENYILYRELESEYSNFRRHPAFFPIIEDNCNDDGSVEHGWKNVYLVDESGNKIISSTAIIEWLDGQQLGEIDYAIYQLGINSNLNLPFEDKDPWPWESENNQLSSNSQSVDLVRPWQLPDNTNGFRGWARVNTAVQQTGSDINIIGYPGVASILNEDGEYKGLKVVNAGNVVNGKGRNTAIRYEEDILIFKDADIWFGNSGSSIIDDSGRLAGVVSWLGCAPGGDWTNTPHMQIALNYATPMWKICRASQIIKDAARDQNCNGIIDWKDYIAEIASLLRNIDVLGLRGHLINNFNISALTSEVQNYRYDLTHNKVIPETKELPPYTYQIAWSDSGNFFYVAKQNNTFYLFKNETALGAISNYPEMSGSATLVKGDDIYLAGGNLSGGISDYFPGVGNNSFAPYVTKISSNGRDYSLSVIAEFPTSLEDVRIFELGNNIYVAGNTTTNFVIYKLVADNQSEFGYSLSLVSDTTQPTRKDYNLTAADGKIIVSGGATDYISTVLNLEEAQYPSTFAVYNNIIMLEPDVSNNWITVAENINDKIIMLSVTAIDDGNLVLVNPFITVGNSMQKFVIDLENIPVSGENLRVYFESHPLVFCLNESENTVSGGLTISGECVPFTHQWYNSFSAGATVYSLDGKGNRLYAGTNNAIKVYDISDPTSPVLVSSFSTSSRVNDIEVYGDVLFAATNGGLYKLDASNDTLTQTLFVSAFLNSQYKVEVYNGKLYVGDDSGIKVRDLETLSVLTSVNNGSVLDFAIENGEIGLYKDALFSPVEIRDADTLALKANEFFGCFEIEVGSSDGRFYLSCDDEIYKFEDDGDGGISFTELSGDIRELQDVYTFDGYTYFYDENTIWISTNNDVPALCGNGIVEGDEVCDGAPINCEELDSNYVSGTATCNSTCDGYNTNNCSDDGW